MDIEKGVTVWYLGKTRCEVLDTTLKAGGVNASEALIFLKSAQGSSIIVPYAFRDEFISLKKIGIFDAWPLKKQAKQQ